jgi:hypothetical protein
MNYQTQLAAFTKFGGAACDMLVEEYSELFLSLDEKDVFEKSVAVAKLSALDLPTPTSAKELCDILARILGELLAEGKIQIAEYGLSTIGQTEFNSLVAGVTQP